MDPEPVFQPDDEPLAHRKRRQSVWQKTPVWVKAAVAVCLILIAVSIATGNAIIEWSQSRLFGKASPIERPKGVHPDSGKSFDEVAAQIKPFDLELSGTTLNEETRRLEGSVWNKSDRTYTEIRIQFALPSAELTAQDSTTIRIDKLAPHEHVKFSSDPLPAGVHQWALINTTGTPSPR